jgi:hypothetical protein
MVFIIITSGRTEGERKKGGREKDRKRERERENEWEKK